MPGNRPFPVKLIMFDLVRFGQSRHNVLGIIESYSSYQKLMGNAYAICTNEKTSEVYARFKPYLLQNDSFTVIELGGEHSAINCREFDNWLSRNLFIPNL